MNGGGITSPFSLEAFALNTIRRTAYPEIQPYSSGRLRVSSLHEIYYEECGNPQGKPVLLVHGGPGGGSNNFMRRLHDPAAYRIILFDQRGCGRSTPHAELRENTTWDLIADMENLREHLGIETWQLLGGSWGSTLSVAYSETHPERVSELVLRGIFLLRRKELLWFYQYGCSEIFPDAWENYLAPIPNNEYGDLIAAYHKRLTSDDKEERLEAARAWSQWEGTTLSLMANPARVSHFGNAQYALAFARIECHYFVNGGFLDDDNQLIADAHKIAHIPGTIVQGRYDVVTPMTTAWALSRAWPGAEMKIVADAGHATTEAGIVHELVEATDNYRR
jgi:proline iminopeptidase